MPESEKLARAPVKMDVSDGTIHRRLELGTAASDKGLDAQGVRASMYQRLLQDHCYSPFGHAARLRKESVAVYCSELRHRVPFPPQSPWDHGLERRASAHREICFASYERSVLRPFSLRLVLGTSRQALR